MKQALITVESIKEFIREARRIDRVMTYKSLRAYLNVSKPTMMAYLNKGMPWFGNPERKQFILSDVIRWIKDNNINPKKYANL